jgi:hypothetical protein
MAKRFSPTRNSDICVGLKIENYPDVAKYFRPQMDTNETQILKVVLSVKICVHLWPIGIGT